MNLFSKEKDLIHRIANLILILWLVIAIFVSYRSGVNLIIKRELLTFEEYKIKECNNNQIKTPGSVNLVCESEYESYKLARKDDDFYTKRNLLHGLGNVVTVGIALYLLNRKTN